MKDKTNTASELDEAERRLLEQARRLRALEIEAGIYRPQPLRRKDR